MLHKRFKDYVSCEYRAGEKKPTDPAFANARTASPPMPLAPALSISSDGKTDLVDRLTAGNNYAFTIYMACVYLIVTVDDAFFVRQIRHIECLEIQRAGTARQPTSFIQRLILDIRRTVGRQTSGRSKYGLAYCRR